ncbi:hypothetical protein WOLCODRAFT_157493 [Wolfiporia cocos MD-104 SS10]|uniref:Uncharacterized protein n=1 Tax=Wolfiporia cocos (strain MD-104) TaxID=742152 RepID=A0A2H3JJD0_WOLCO|nr:hypothetical protein WOLCODRAFT_157493 [Wolfiporia cocos MD-104 SS10]
MNWEQNESNRAGHGKSQSLLDDVLFAPDFNLSDIEGLNVTHEWAHVDAAADEQIDHLPATEGWTNDTVTIPLPKEGMKWAKENDAPVLKVPNVWHRNLLQIIKSVCHSEEAVYHHWVPFKQYWRRPEVYDDNASEEESPEKMEDIRIYSELYNSDALLNEYEKLHAQPRNPDDPPDTEVSIVPIMLWSDSTHLTNFGNASLWPIYMYFGSMSKYTCGKPTASASHHLAYMPSVSLI